MSPRLRSVIFLELPVAFSTSAFLAFSVWAESFAVFLLAMMRCPFSVAVVCRIAPIAMQQGQSLTSRAGGQQANVVENCRSFGKFSQRRIHSDKMTLIRQCSLPCANAAAKSLSRMVNAIAFCPAWGLHADYMEHGDPFPRRLPEH